MIDKFPCTKCTLCCKILGCVLQNTSKYDDLTQSLIKQFPYKPLDNGTCEMLTEDGLCSVYDTRPDLCNIATMAKLKGIPLLTYYQQTSLTCNQLVNIAGLDPKYLVYIEQSSKETSQTYEEGRTGPRKKRRRKTS